MSRTLVIAHAHPDISLGGGEIAAHQHWAELRRQGDDAVFLARAPGESGHAGSPFTARSADGKDLLFHLPAVDHFRHSQPVRQLVYEDFRALLDRIRPTAVHFHHYVHLGLELVREVRRHNPQIPIVMTLHDYLGICNAQGQMVKTDGRLCQRALPRDCEACFPGQSAQTFFMRELFIKSFFRLVDAFVSPSRFLRDRYVAWGLPAERFLVLENGQVPAPAAAATPMDTGMDAVRASEPHTRFVVLGQLSRLKGTPVLLEAAQGLPKAVARNVHIEIHGSIQHADPAFQADFHKACKRLAPMLRYAGPYLPGDVPGILGDGAWLVVPSIWWENSPMVIQEALRARCPVIVSNIGGMAEKITHGVDGLHFRVNSASDLARTMALAAQSPALWQGMRQRIQAPPAIARTVGILRELYELPRESLELSLPQLREAHGLPS